MTVDFFKKAHKLYEIKRNKYKKEEISEKLDQMLWQEALTEVRASEVYNGK